MSEANDTQRVHASFVARAEKKLLIAIATRLPVPFTPDVLTALGVVGSILVTLGYWLSQGDANWLWLANFGLLLHWFGDSLDGTVARVRSVERPRYGFFVDQTIDVVGNLFIMVGVGLSPWVRMDSALMAVAGFHMLAIYSLVHASVSKKHAISMAGIGPTELRMILIGMNLVLYFYGATPGIFGFGDLTWADLLMLLGFVVMLVIFLAGFVSYARQLANEERLPR